jgi:hypothetical protein
MKCCYHCIAVVGNFRSTSPGRHREDSLGTTICARDQERIFFFPRATDTANVSFPFSYNVCSSFFYKWESFNLVTTQCRWRLRLSRSQQKPANHLLPTPRSHHLQIFFSSFFELIHTIPKDSIQSQATYIKLILEPG